MFSIAILYYKREFFFELSKFVVKYFHWIWTLGFEWRAIFVLSTLEICIYSWYLDTSWTSRDVVHLWFVLEKTKVHFCLNDFVNQQSCRIWRSKNSRYPKRHYKYFVYSRSQLDDRVLLRPIRRKDNDADSTSARWPDVSFKIRLEMRNNTGGPKQEGTPHVR